MATERVELRDGDIVLYRRSGKGNAKWHCEFKIPKSERRFLEEGRLRFTTGKRDFEEAKRWAFDKLDELRYRKTRRLPLKDWTFEKVALDYLTNMEQEVEHNNIKQNWLDQARSVVTKETGLIAYFWKDKKLKIHQITNTEIRDWAAWRLEQPTQRTPNSPKLSKTTLPTLANEMTFLRALFRHAVKLSALRDVDIPTIKGPTLKHNRRPHFTQAQYDELAGRFIPNWTRQKYCLNKNGVQHFIQPWARYYRVMLRFYILFMVNVYCRVGEGRQLKWKHLETKRDTQGRFWLYVNIPDGKTGPRPGVVAMPQAIDHLKRWREITTHPNYDDYIFCHPLTVKKTWTELPDEIADNQLKNYVTHIPGTPGKPIGFPHGAWESLMEDAFAAGVLGEERKRWTLYSLRHTGIDMRVVLSDTPLDVIADNAGTSVDMIRKHYKHSLPKDKADSLIEMKQRQGKVVDVTWAEIPDRPRIAKNLSELTKE